MLRRPARWVRETAETRLDEDWTLVLVGVLVVVVTLGLGITAAWTAHQRGAALQNATAAGNRLNVGGHDERLYQDLIKMQQDEVSLFQARVDPGQAAAKHNPTTDLNNIENTDLTALKNQFAGSAQVQRDITLIYQEMGPYAAAETSALDYNQQGLPVGGAYLRAASAYLTTYALPDADNILQVDENQVTADDATAAAVPWPLLALAVIVLACLIAAQVLLSRYTRCQFDPWLLLSTAVTVVLIAWSVTALSVSASAVNGGTSPHAREASVLARALVDTITAGNDDALTLADHGEDCSATNPRDNNFEVTCSFETQVLSSLNSRAGARADLLLAQSDAPDVSTRATYIEPALKRVKAWANDEGNLPTLQNLHAAAQQAAQQGVGSPAFKQFLRTYSVPPPSVGAHVTGDFTAVLTYVQSATQHEWASYDSAADGAGGPLGGAVTGTVLLALLAAAAGGLGIGRRVAEYWSPGGRA